MISTSRLRGSPQTHPGHVHTEGHRDPTTPSGCTNTGGREYTRGSAARLPRDGPPLSPGPGASPLVSTPLEGDQGGRGLRSAAPPGASRVFDNGMPLQYF